MNFYITTKAPLQFNLSQQKNIHFFSGYCVRKYKAYQHKPKTSSLILEVLCYIRQELFDGNANTMALIDRDDAPIVVQPLLGVEYLLQNVLRIRVIKVLLVQLVQMLVKLLQLIHQVVVELLVALCLKWIKLRVVVHFIR